MESPVQKELCFVLRSTPYRERDQIVVLLTESRGKVHAIARNSIQSRRFGGCLNLFTAAEVELDTRSIRISEATDEKLVGLQSATIRQSFESIAKRFEKVSAASAMNELLLRTIPNHKQAPELFKLYANSLMALNEVEEDASILGFTNTFILKLTQWLGVQPSITRCLTCEKTLAETNGNLVYMQIPRAGWICTECDSESRSLPLTKDVVYDAFQGILNPIRKTSFISGLKEQTELLSALEQHLLYHVAGLERKPIASLQFLKQFAEESLKPPI